VAQPRTPRCDNHHASLGFSDCPGDTTARCTGWESLAGVPASEEAQVGGAHRDSLAGSGGTAFLVYRRGSGQSADVSRGTLAASGAEPAATVLNRRPRRESARSGQLPSAGAGDPRPAVPGRPSTSFGVGRSLDEFQPDGTADTTSFQVLLSDDREFATAVIEALRRARYRPAEVGGVPTAAHVHQRFIFRIR